jgi:23S rRNA (guanine745-N1)-methyltransferase
VLDAAVPHLRCPHEGGALQRDDRTLRCAAGHAFDLARQGYVNLVTGSGGGVTGDDAAMVAARTEVFDAGHLAPLSAALAAEVGVATPAGGGAVVDLGAGTGHHLAAVLESGPPERVGLALDRSKHAARRAARSHPRVGAVVCDVWQPLPVRSDAAAAVLCVFAPRNATEIDRVLRADGVVVVATPTRGHLAELIQPLGLLSVDPRKEERLEATLSEVLVREHVALHEHTLTLDHATVTTLVGMGPSAHHLAGDVLADRLTALPDPVTVTVSVQLGRYRSRP